MSKRAIVVTGEKEDRTNFNELISNLNTRVLDVDVVGVTANQTEIFTQLARVSEDGIKDVIILPLSIPQDNEMLMKINGCINKFLDTNMGVQVEIVNDYTSDLILEDMIWETITSKYTDKDLLPELGRNIETLSHHIIDGKLRTISNMSVREKVVARRIIHATADYSFANTLRFSSGAVKKGVDAIKSGKPIICDVNMLKTAMTKVESEIICSISEPEIVELAKEKMCTRAAAAMMSLEDKLDGAIVVIGNAPTAIWQLLKMNVKPALVVGLPVGFVGARESKLELIKSDHEYIANTSPRGGSPAAAAALNALALLAKAHQN